MARQGAYWFPAKRYGWGWGLPLTWQGWAVLIAYAALLAAGMRLLSRDGPLLPFLAYVLTMSLALLAVCYVKGEGPRWRWREK